MPTLRERLKGSSHVIIESNSILKFLRPDLYITVLDPATADFKVSAREFLDRADAAILHETENGDLAWKDVSLKPVANKPIFQIAPPPYITPDVVEFVRSRLR
jgi:hypothetical protein